MIFLDKVAVGDGRRHFGDVAHLSGQVAGHEVHIVGEILPRTGDAFHIGLAAEFSFGSHFARHARHFRGKRTELIHHGVDGVLQFENFASHIHRNFLGQVAVGDGRGHFGDVAHLSGQVAGHEVHVVGEILPGARHTLHVRLPAELSFRTDFARHARHF